MRNIEVTLGNKVRHILNKLNIKGPITITKHNSHSGEFGDDFDGSKAVITIPDIYEIQIPADYSEKLWKHFWRFELKCEKKYDLMVNIYFMNS